MNVTPKALEDALDEVDFPADKEEILASAEGRDVQEEVLRALRSMPPEVRYDNAGQVVRSVRQPAAGTEPTAQQASVRHQDAEHSGVAERLR